MGGGEGAFMSRCSNAAAPQHSNMPGKQRSTAGWQLQLLESKRAGWAAACISVVTRYSAPPTKATLQALRGPQSLEASLVGVGGNHCSLYLADCWVSVALKAVVVGATGTRGGAIAGGDEAIETKAGSAAEREVRGRGHMQRYLRRFSGRACTQPLGQPGWGSLRHTYSAEQCSLARQRKQARVLTKLRRRVQV